MAFDTSSSFVINYVYWSNIHTAVCHTNTIQNLLQSLFIIYRNGPPSCTEVAQAESACSSYTKIGLYRKSSTPLSRSGHVPIWSYPVCDTQLSQLQHTLTANQNFNLSQRWKVEQTNTTMMTMEFLARLSTWKIINLRRSELWTHFTDTINVSISLASLQQLWSLDDRLKCLLNICILQLVVTQPLLQVTQVVPAKSNHTLLKFLAHVWASHRCPACSPK